MYLHRDLLWGDIPTCHTQLTFCICVSAFNPLTAGVSNSCHHVMWCIMIFPPLLNWVWEWSARDACGLRPMILTALSYSIYCKVTERQIIEPYRYHWRMSLLSFSSEGNQWKLQINCLSVANCYYKVESLLQWIPSRLHEGIVMQMPPKDHVMVDRDMKQ